MIAPGDVAKARSLFVFRSNGTGQIGTRVFGVPNVIDQPVQTYAFSADSKRLFARGNFFGTIHTQLLSTTDFESVVEDLNAARVIAPPPGGEVQGFAVAR
jgi:hypothetical protein